MKQTSLEMYLKEAYAEAKPAADAHYKALFDCFMASIPDYLHRTGEYAPKAERPLGFNATVDNYSFGLNLPEDGYALTFALFVYGKKSGWRLDRFSSQVALNPFQMSARESKSLCSAVLTAKEMRQDHDRMMQEMTTKGLHEATALADGLVQ